MMFSVRSTLYPPLAMHRRPEQAEPSVRWEYQMNLHSSTTTLAVGLTLWLPPPSLSSTQAVAAVDRPQVLEVSSVGLEKNTQLSSLIAEIRSQADALFQVVPLQAGSTGLRDAITGVIAGTK
jgi:hypothetical protein